MTKICPRYATAVVYENDQGETFTRVSDNYGYTDKFDAERETKGALDEQLKRWGFTRIVGYEREVYGTTD